MAEILVVKTYECHTHFIHFSFIGVAETGEYFAISAVFLS